MGLRTPWTRLVWAGFLFSVAATDGLMVRQEPHTDTRLYVAPATHTRREGKALPSTIIISRPLGVREDPEDDDVSTVSTEEDHSSEDDLDLKSNIRFYKIECTGGRSCSSIIPARTTTARPPPPGRAYDDIDIRKYLAQFNLRDGFPYTDDFESSGTPKEDESERHFSEHPAAASSSSSSLLDRQNPRAFGSSSDHAMSNHWPGSAYRPRPLPSKGLVFKYQQYQPPRRTPSIDDFPTRRPAIQWDKIYESFPSRRPAMEWQRVPSGMEKKKKKPLRPHSPSRPTSESSSPSYQSSRPSQQFSEPHVPFERDDNIVFPPYDLPRPSSTTRTTLRPPPYDGVWNRYSTSTVSQLNKDTGEWVKVSSSSTQLDKGVFERPTNSPNALFSPSHHAVASLTVLGLSDVRQPLSTFHDSTARDPHLVEVPSALPGRPPALIETDGGHVGATAAEDVSPSSPRQTSSSSSSSSSTTTTSTSPPDPPTSVASSELSQVSVPFLLISTKSLTGDQSSTSTPLTTTTTTTTASTSTSPSTTTTRPRPQPLVTRAATTRAATTTTTTSTTTTTTTTQAPHPAEEGSFLDNPYAVMAAAGVGLIPLTFAALLPAFIGRRRRRRSAGDASGSDAFPDGAARPSEVEELSARVRRAVRSLEGGGQT